MRLQKFLAQAGVSSRRRAEELIRGGKVRVNGQAVTTLGTSVDPGKDRVELEGKRVHVEEPLYRVLLKPRGCLSTLEQEPQRGPVRGKPARPAGEDAKRPTIARFIPDRALGWKVVAPLDFLAEGVILLTTDGELADRLSRGGGLLPMTYHIKYQGQVGDQEIGRLLRGWKWDRRTVKPESAVALATTGKNTWVEMIVREARPRVLKVSGEAIRRQVLKISRVRFGPFSFEGLAMGGFRDLNKKEAKGLRRAAGLEG
jgi:23S rRNA pseudouridine2605 synthase